MLAWEILHRLHFHAERECFNMQCKSCLWLDYNLYSTVPLQTLVINMSVSEGCEVIEISSIQKSVKNHFSLSLLF